MTSQQVSQLTSSHIACNTCLFVLSCLWRSVVMVYWACHFWLFWVFFKNELWWHFHKETGMFLLRWNIFTCTAAWLCFSSCYSCRFFFKKAITVYFFINLQIIVLQALLGRAWSQAVAKACIWLGILLGSFDLTLCQDGNSKNRLFTSSTPYGDTVIANIMKLLTHITDIKTLISYIFSFYWCFYVIMIAISLCLHMLIVCSSAHL